MTTAFNLSPASAQARLYPNVTFTWDISGGTQYEIDTRVEINSTGVEVFSSSAVQSSQSVTWNLTGLAQDTLLRWRIRIKDVSGGTYGAWSSYATFTMGGVPTVNVTAPAESAVIGGPQPTVTWTRTLPGARTQVSFFVEVHDNVAGVYTLVYSANVLGSALTHTLSSPVLDSGRTWRVRVTITDSLGYTAVDSNNFTTSYSTPVQPVFAVGSPSLPYMRVTWTNALKDGTWVGWRVYRYNLDDTTTTLPVKIYETLTDQANYTYDDWLFQPGTNYRYVVVQVATRTSIPVESVKTVVSNVTPYSEDYWILHPTTPALSVLLSQVNTDDFTDEQESEELLLIGRGRKVDYGTHWGIKGSLACKLWNRTDMTARQQWLALRTLKNLNIPVYLRTPFGDLLLVSLGELGKSRIPQAGTRDHAAITIPYSEVR